MEPSVPMYYTITKNRSVKKCVMRKQCMLKTTSGHRYIWLKVCTAPVQQPWTGLVLPPRYHSCTLAAGPERAPRRQSFPGRGWRGKQVSPPTGREWFPGEMWFTRTRPACCPPPGFPRPHRRGPRRELRRLPFVIRVVMQSREMQGLASRGDWTGDMAIGLEN